MSYVNTFEKTAGQTADNPEDAFDTWLARADRAEWVESPNQRRNGTSGVKTTWLNGKQVYIKIQQSHGHRDLKHPFGRATVLREAEAIEACHRLGIIAPQIRYCGTRGYGVNQQAILVTRALDGYQSFETILADHWQGYTPSERAQILDRMAYTFSQWHKASWQHSALYPKHVYIRLCHSEEGETSIRVGLIDLEKSRQRLRATHASRHDMRQFRKHAPALSEQEWLWLKQCYQRYFSD